MISRLPDLLACISVSRLCSSLPVPSPSRTDLLVPDSLPGFIVCVLAYSLVRRKINLPLHSCNWTHTTLVLVFVTEYLTLSMDPAELHARLSQQEERIEEMMRLLRHPGPTPPPSGMVAVSASVPNISLPSKYDGSPGKCKGFLMQCSKYIAYHPGQFSRDQNKVDFVISLLTDKALDWATALWSANSPELGSEAQFLALFREVFDHPVSGRNVGDQLVEIRQGTRTAAAYALEFRTLAAGSGWSEAALLTVYRRGLNRELQAELACRGDLASLSEYINVSIAIDNLLVDRRRTATLRPRPAPSTSSVSTPPATPPEPEPMQLGRSRLSAAEHHRRRSEGLCLYCGERGYFASRCPIRPPRPGERETSAHHQVGSTHLLNVTHKQLHLPVCLTVRGNPFCLEGLVDSGAAGSFMDLDTAEQLGIKLYPIEPPLRVKSLDGGPLGSGYVRHQTEPLDMQVGALHTERIQLLVVSSPHEPVVLGHPWLCLHDPDISWRKGELTAWNATCLSRCLSVPCRATSVESATPSTTPEPPSAYSQFRQVFSEEKASELPPHRPWDCAIELIEGAPLPRGRVYPLSVPETEAMNTYIDESLRQGAIRPSTSPAASSFFFIGKKDGGLRPCIDYRGLNAVTIKNRYPLPLISAALEQIGQASIFTKLDLRSAYHLVRIRKGDEWKTAFITQRGHYEYRVMPFGLTNAPAVFQAFMNDIFRDMIDRFVIIYLDDILIYSGNLTEHVGHVRQVLQRLQQHKLYVKLEKSVFHVSKVAFLGSVLSPGCVQMDESKVSAVRQWPPPKTVKELQRFLGFANYYRRFIRNFSTIAAPLTALTSQKTRTLCWTDAAKSAFERLKDLFTSAPILHQPDSGLPFVVEVDASETGVGAILSQRVGTPPKLRPCAFYSKKLTPAQRNYDVGNRELLAIKLALEEWRHWLEGALHPFLVLTDHRNLEYLQSAKRLNPRQARWSLFFNRFRFSVSYVPGKKNAKADSLSRLFEQPTCPLSPETILPSTCRVGPIRWDIQDTIEEALLTDPAPPTCPPGKIYVPAAVRPQLLQWCHTSLGTGHPGITRTTKILGKRYWWASQSDDVRDYVLSCPVCAQSKSPRHLPEGLLQPLPTPHRPWSHIAMDFITDLPDSNGYTSILTVVDRFSKMCRLIPLANLPNATELADLVFQQVFRQFGIPEDIVSDRGPQFISRVWRAFCDRLGVSVSLSSGYHPETNGQTERLNQDIGKYLRQQCHKQPHDWSRFLPWVEYAQNSLIHSSLRLTPFQCVFGYQPPLFPWDTEPGPVPAVDEWFRRSARVWETAHRHLQQASSAQKTYADRRRRPSPLYHPGQRVWLSTRDIRLCLPCRK
uniref:Gypsy retrotransposon integrase-like protein 1 n=1 Tax=Esox lucius TaxID=8010 RepID=A0A6Q2Y968_ESOLU